MFYSLFPYGRSLLLCLFMPGILAFAMSCTSEDPERPEEPDPWTRVGSILERIERPVFPTRNFPVGDFGAIADDSVDDLPAFREAIDSCNASGGGTVQVGAGTYELHGPIHMKSNVHLSLSEGTVLKFSHDPAHYLPVVRTRWEGVECYNYSALIYAYEAENIAITGKGLLDGQADTTNWWPWKGNRHDGWTQGQPSQLDPSSRDRLIQYNREQVPVEERIFGDKGNLRPNFIQPYACKNVHIEGITITNSPMWVIHPVLCENVVVENVTVNSHGPNNDGCNPESCKDVLIQDCLFDTGDDCIALKSGRNQDGRRINRPTENVVIRRCHMKDGHGGVVIGSEVSGGCRNIFAEDCSMDSPNLDRAIRVKTNRSRGGLIENLFFRNIEVGRVKEAVVKVNMRYTLDDTISVAYPEIRNIYVENVNSQESEYGIRILGLDDEHPVSHVSIVNCNFRNVEKGNDIQFIDSLHVENVTINGDAWTHE